MANNSEVFSIRGGRTTSYGSRVEMTKPPYNESASPADAEFLAFLTELGIELKGSYIWKGGTIGDLWKFQAETMRFIEDNLKKV